MKPARSKARQVRYAVVGLGHIAQAAVLPAFAGARKNSKLVALVSGDPVKHRALCKKYKIERAYSYQEYEDCLRNEQVDAVYIALPNHMHREYAVKAAKMGVHVLCEKPLAVTEQDCRAMIETARENRVRLMTAYRLHFEKANLCAIDILKSGKIGEPKLFDSVFTLQVRPGDIRVQKNLGGGTLYDIGIYCINAARYLFRAEPYEVMAFTSKSSDPRFSEVEESSSVLLRFPGARLASFT
ncbi:MAG: Gfo/Idh/MocA family oxidoreductase, partial [Verrucomicrobiae bacterium]|nr:Gfo/Idh/MocA family oxidoreductase [Verrucomicrobiae bacterium]